MVKIKAYELRTRSEPELLKQLAELKRELAQLYVAKATGSVVAKLCKIKVVRKGIARVLTVYNQKRKADARAAYKGKKYVRFDLRPKKTRAQRKALKPSQKFKLTLRARKKAENIPKRCYALRQA